MALVHHRFYEETYTFDIYLGRTFTFALAAPGYPAFASGRFTKFTNASPSDDGFFSGYSGEAVEAAAEAVESALTGFTAQQGLAGAVREVRLLRTIRDIDLAIVETVNEIGEIDRKTPRLQPKESASRLKPDWYVAAERTLVAHESALGYGINANHVRSFALDAWRCAETSVVNWM